MVVRYITRVFEARVRSTAFAAGLLLAACGGSNEPPVGSASKDFEELTLVTYPGYVNDSPPGSSCSFAQYPQTFTLDAASHVLTWDLCGAPSNATLHEVLRGERTLTGDEFASVVAALDAVQPSRAAACGSDASVFTLDLETPSGTRYYANDFYAACPWEIHEGRTFVKGLPELSVAVADLGR